MPAAKVTAETAAAQAASFELYDFAKMFPALGAANIYLTPKVAATLANRKKHVDSQSHYFDLANEQLLALLAFSWRKIFARGGVPASCVSSNREIAVVNLEFNEKREIFANGIVTLTYVTREHSLSEWSKAKDIPMSGDRWVEEVAAERIPADAIEQSIAMFKRKLDADSDDIVALKLPAIESKNSQTEHFGRILPGIKTCAQQRKLCEVAVTGASSETSLEIVINEINEEKQPVIAALVAMQQIIVQRRQEYEIFRSSLTKTNQDAETTRQSDDLRSSILALAILEQEIASAQTQLETEANAELKKLQDFDRAFYQKYIQVIQAKFEAACAKLWDGDPANRATDVHRADRLALGKAIQSHASTVTAATATVTTESRQYPSFSKVFSHFNDLAAVALQFNLDPSRFFQTGCDSSFQAHRTEYVKLHRNSSNFVLRISEHFKAKLPDFYERLAKFKPIVVATNSNAAQSTSAGLTNATCGTEYGTRQSVKEMTSLSAEELQTVHAAIKGKLEELQRYYCKERYFGKSDLESKQTVIDGLVRLANDAQAITPAKLAQTLENIWQATSILVNTQRYPKLDWLRASKCCCHTGGKLVPEGAKIWGKIVDTPGMGSFKARILNDLDAADGSISVNFGGSGSTNITTVAGLNAHFTSPLGRGSSLEMSGRLQWSPTGRSMEL